MTQQEEDRLIELYHLGWGDHKRGEVRPSHYPDRAMGWDAREDAMSLSVPAVTRPEGYYHYPIGTFE